MKHIPNEYDAHASLVQWVSTVERHKAILNARSVQRHQRVKRSPLRVVLWVALISCFAAIGTMIAY